MKLNKISQVLLAAACLASASASASVVSYDSSVLGTDLTDLAGSLSFKQFDPTMGILTGVHIDVYSDVVGQVDLTSTASRGKDVSVSLSVDLLLQKPDASTIVSVAGASIFDTMVHVNAHGSASYSNSQTVSGNVDLPSSDFALFTGHGNLDAPLSVTASTVGDASNVTVDFTTTANGYGKVTYTYEAMPVPEPETYGMLLLGLGVLAGAAKRKSRAKQA